MRENVPVLHLVRPQCDNVLNGIAEANGNMDPILALNNSQLPIRAVQNSRILTIGEQIVLQRAREVERRRGISEGNVVQNIVQNI